MGFYRTQVLPRLVDRACGSAGMQGWRAEVTAGLAGTVVEIGFGSGKVLYELRRVLRPGARFHFLEHGLAPDPSVARWQHRLDPWQRRLADGCHLTRDAEALVTDAGFLMEEAEHRYAKGPKPWSWFSLGVAANPSVSTR